MLDRYARRRLEPLLVRLARPVARRGVRADRLTLLGAGAGAAAGVAVALDCLAAGAALAALSRLADGLDGVLARLGRASDLGGYLDIVGDFVFYVAIPLGFAVREPAAALATAFLLGGYVLTGVSFLAFSAAAERQGLAAGLADGRSYVFQPGLAEGTETLLVYAAMFAWPPTYATLAWVYAAACGYTAVARTVVAVRLFGEQGAGLSGSRRGT